MSNELPTVRAVVAEFGASLSSSPSPSGVSETAKHFGIVENAVWNWISANRFPAYTVFEIQPILKKRRKSAPDTLWARTRRLPSASSRKEATA